ncbi:MAG: DUF2147 domain-containing protein [Sphingomicrobium sp.]
MPKLMKMKKIIPIIALGAAILAAPSTASARAPLEGQWKNPKGSVVVRVAACGNAYCGTVIDASAKAKATARKGGTPNLVGTRILHDVRAAGNGTYKGRAFDPKRNIRAPATIRVLGPSTISIKGCVLRGLICKEQRWTRVS